MLKNALTWVDKEMLLDGTQEGFVQGYSTSFFPQDKIKE